MSGFFAVCGVCFTERKSSSSNRNLNFDYCTKCKETTTFIRERPRPALLTAASLPLVEKGVVLRFRDDPKYEDVFVTDDAMTSMRWASLGKMKLTPAWMPVSCEPNLHSGVFRVKFNIEDMGDGQLGVGFGLAWNVGIDWGFFGYLGASQSAWSYDPSSGDVVNDKESIAAGLPRFESGSGLVQLNLTLPRFAPGQASFTINDVETPTIALPEGAVITPAVCFLKLRQKIDISTEVISIDDSMPEAITTLTATASTMLPTSTHAIPTATETAIVKHDK